MAVSNCPSLTLSPVNVMLDAKISLVPMHQLIVPSTLLAPATQIRTRKVTKLHILKPLTYCMSYFFKIALKQISETDHATCYQLDSRIYPWGSRSGSLMEHNLQQKHQGQGCQLCVSQLCTKCLKLEKLSKILLQTKNY